MGEVRLRPIKALHGYTRFRAREIGTTTPSLEARHEVCGHREKTRYSIRLSHGKDGNWQNKGHTTSVFMNFTRVGQGRHPDTAQLSDSLHVNSLCTYMSCLCL